MNFPANDSEFEDTTITHVELTTSGYQITRAEGWSFFVEKECGIVPNIGDHARFYGGGIGSIVRGLFIHGQKCFYRTKTEQEEKNSQDSEVYKQRQREEFEENKADLDAAYRDLSPEFKRRIDKFRNANLNFRWEFEGYEMMCCVDALNIATHLKTVEAVKAWADLPYEKQKKSGVPFNDGHSGNSFGCAVRLAAMFLTDPELVVKAHGALTPLTGCKDYGCPHDE